MRVKMYNGEKQKYKYLYTSKRETQEQFMFI